MSFLPNRRSCRLAPVIAALLLAATGRSGGFAGTVFDLGNTDINGITGPGASQLTQPYATLDILENTALGWITFTLSTSSHNAGSSINAVFNDISFNTALTLGTDFSLLSASN